MTRKLTQLLTISALTLGSLVCLTLAATLPVHAQAPCVGNPTKYDPNNICIGTGGVDANGDITCAKTGPCTQDNAAKPSKSTGIALIDNYANPIINTAAGCFGIFVAIQIVIGGIQYSNSADDASKVNAAKSRITNAVLALLAFLFLYTFLQWITPGGFLN